MGTNAMNELIETGNFQPEGANSPANTVEQVIPQFHAHIQKPTDLQATRTALPEPETKLLSINGGNTNQKSDDKGTSFQVDDAGTRLLSEKETGLMSKGIGRDVNSDTLLNVNKAKYEYVGEIAQGGMGRIVAVRDRSLRRRVAMKLLISPNGKPMRQQVNRLLAEAQTTGQLEHPNIVPIHDVGIYQDNKYYFTMKLVKGNTLKDVFRQLDNKDAVANEQY